MFSIVLYEGDQVILKAVGRDIYKIWRKFAKLIFQKYFGSD